MANVMKDLQPISSNKDHYNAAYSVWKQRSSHQKTVIEWIQSILPSYVEHLAQSKIDHIDILGVGSGAGEVEEVLLSTLLSRFSSINNRSIEPSDELHGEYEKRINRNPKFSDVDFDWRHQTLAEYRATSEARERPREDGQFDVITAIDSLYYVDDVDAALSYLYQLLAPGGLLIVRLVSEKIGFGPLWHKFPVLYGYQPIPTSADIRNFCERHSLDHTVYEVNTLGTDITGCFDDEPSTGDSLALDFLTATINFTKNVSSDTKQEVLDYLESSNCAEKTDDGRVLLVSGAQNIVIKKGIL